MMIGKRSDGELYFAGKIDEIKIYNKAMTVDEIKSLYNLLNNSSFEAGLGNGKTWSIATGNPVLDTNIVYAGNQAVKFVKPDSSEASQSIITLNDYISVTPGQSYQLSAWVKGDNIQVGTETWHKFFATGRWYDADMNVIFGSYPDLTFPTGTYDWQQITRTITAPANAEYFHFSSIGIQKTATGTAWLDQIIICPKNP
jgi:hypothetical protein